MAKDGSGAAVTVKIGDAEFAVRAHEPFVFGRADGPDIVGLDPNDMGISAEAGSVESELAVWWVVNRSAKRRLLIEEPGAVQPTTLDCGGRHAITVPRLAVLVPGAIYTHRLEIVVPDELLAALRRSDRSTTGTLTADDVTLSERDRDAVTAMFAGYLRPFPHHDPKPATYQRAADTLGGAWTKVTVRKQVERLKERLARSGVYFDGPRANDELGEYLVREGVLTVDDLSRLPARS